ncbi:MAG TPA: TonB family protein [bacterium]|nr:TonB family protein [bacterium]
MTAALPFMSTREKLYQFAHRVHVERALVFTLLLIIFTLQIIPKRFVNKQPELAAVKISIKVEDIPATEQRLRHGNPAPSRPVIPVPSDEVYPEDDTIDETNVRWTLGDSPFGRSGLTIGKADTIPPRPLMQTLPEYPEELQKKRVEGSVKLLLKVDENGRVVDVVMAGNTTGSEECRELAVAAAYKSTYIPARSDNRNIEMWTSCVYSFKQSP